MLMQYFIMGRNEKIFEIVTKNMYNAGAHGRAGRGGCSRVRAAAATREKQWSLTVRASAVELHRAGTCGGAGRRGRTRRRQPAIILYSFDLRTLYIY